MITVKAHPDRPAATLAITGLPAGTARLLVERIAADQAWVVRGSATAFTGTAGLVQDYEAPTGIPVWWRVAALDGAGASLGVEESEPHTFPDAEANAVWLSDPLDASSARQVVWLAGSDDTRSHTAEVRLAVPMGARLGVASTSTGLNPDGWAVTLCARDAAEAASLRAFLREAAGLCVRAPAWRQLPPLIYCDIAKAVERFSPTRARIHSSWDLDLQPSVGPGIEPVVWEWTYDDLDAYCDEQRITHATLPDWFPTYLDVELGAG